MTAQPPAKPQTRPGRKPLPPRAYAVFGVTAVLFAVSLGVRLAGYSLDRWGRAIVDGPTLAAVALSSLIIATRRHEPNLETHQNSIKDQQP